MYLSFLAWSVREGFVISHCTFCFLPSSDFANDFTAFMRHLASTPLTADATVLSNRFEMVHHAGSLLRGERICPPSRRPAAAPHVVSWGRRIAHRRHAHGSQVFDPDGTGFEFVAYDAREFTTDHKGNPYLTYQEMQSVLSKSLLLYQNGHIGRIPRKVFVHKSSHFTEDETQGALDAFGGRTEVELIQVIRHSNWYGLKVDAPRSQDQKPTPTSYTVDRCLYLPMGPNECLLWTQGSVIGINVERSGQPVFKEAPLKPLADPILLRRFSGQGGWHDSCSGVLGLTKVDWNNNTLYKTMPVTLVYSQLFADVVKQVPQIVDDVYDYRLFM